MFIFIKNLMTDDQTQDPQGDTPGTSPEESMKETGTTPTLEANPSEEVAQLKEKLARAQADYQNLLMRQERDRISSFSMISGDILARILPTLDHLERALDMKKDAENDAFVDGIRSTYNGLVKTLESLGVKGFASVGEEVDADKHEVVMQ